MDYRSLIERAFEHLENDDLGKAVMACLRLARHIHDYLNAAVFLREIDADKMQFSRVFSEDTAKLNDEQREYVKERSLEIWLAGRTNEFVEANFDGAIGDRRNVVTFSAGQLDSEVKRIEQAIGDLTVPVGMSPFDTAAFTDNFTKKKAFLRSHIQSLQLTRERIKARCLTYAISLERQLVAQEQQQAFLVRVQTDVNNYFKGRSEDVYLRLLKASELVTSEKREDHSALLTTVRRSLTAMADYFYPAKSEPVVCSDGVKRILGEDQFLNRLQEFLAVQFGPGSSADLMRAEVQLLAAFSRKLNTVASKGVHTNVTAQEAKQGLVGLYMFLYNVISRLQDAPESTSSQSDTATV